MKRRDFLGATIAIGMSSTAVLSAAQADVTGDDVCDVSTDTLGGMSLDALRQDYRKRLFEQYLPFWEKGAYDPQRGGFTCELNDDGSIAEDEKFIWYQGRGLWVYSFLYNKLQADSRWLRIATMTREFMVKHMYVNDGNWVEKVRRDGTLLEGIGSNVYGGLFAAAGLAQYYAATRQQQDLTIIKQSIERAMQRYDDPMYNDEHTTKYTAVDVPVRGLRTQGHSMVLVWTLSQLLQVCDDPELAELQRKHVDLLIHRFWNEDYGIANEYLDHEYSRIPSAESHMYAGHALETQWILLHEALRIKDRGLFDLLIGRIRRLLEMCWDYVYDGWANGDFFVAHASKHHQGPDYNIKTMWAQCEAMGACLTVLDCTGEAWAKDWYDRVRAFAIKTMPVPEHGVWRQAVNRQGKDIQRVGLSVNRKDNFHQARMLMLGLLSLDHMIKN